MISFSQASYIEIVNIYTCEIKLKHEFEANIIKYVSCNVTSPHRDHQTNFAVDMNKFSNNQLVLVGVVLNSMEFILYEIKNDFNLFEMIRIPPPGFDLTSFRFTGNENEFLNDYLIMCYDHDNTLGILDLNDLCTFNLVTSKRKKNTCYKVIDELKNVCLMIGTVSQCLYLINASESFKNYLKVLIEISGTFTSGKIMKTSYEIESNAWSCRVCAMSRLGVITIYDTTANLVDQSQYSILKIAEFTAHNDVITFAFIKGIFSNQIYR